MSNAYIPLMPVLITDEITDVNDVNKIAIVQSGTQVSRKSFVPNSSSPSLLSFSCPPPSGSIIVSRNVKFQLPIRLVLTGKIYTTDNAFNAPTSLLNAGRDAPRMLPASNAMDTIRVQINNTAVTMPIGDVITPLNRFYVDSDLRSKEYSSTPSYPDKSYSYESLVGTNLNPLGSYGSSAEGTCQPRGGFPFTILAGTNVPVVPTVAGTAATATVDFYVTEDIMLSPFQFSTASENNQGFYNVQSMDFVLNMLTNAGFRLWSHCNLVASSGATRIDSIIESISVQFDNFNTTAFSYPHNNRPTLAFEYITPNILSKEVLTNQTPITYPYFNVNRFTTDIGTITAGAGEQVKTSQTFQVSSIPDRIYVFARPSNSVYQSRCDIPDCYLGIKAVDVQWANQPSLLTTASQVQLYNMFLRNGGSMSWTEWSGLGVNNSFLPPSVGSAQYGGVGGILALETSKDIQLMPNECPGLGGDMWQFQIRVTLENMAKDGSWDALPMTLYVVTISSGVFTITSLGNATSQEGVISKQDVLNAVQIPGINFQTVSGGRKGGNWLSSIQDFASKVNEFLKESKAISRGSRALGLAGVPYASEIGTFADALGYGKGGKTIQNHGGQSYSRRQLRS